MPAFVHGSLRLMSSLSSRRPLTQVFLQSIQSANSNTLIARHNTRHLSTTSRVCSEFQAQSAQATGASQTNQNAGSNYASEMSSRSTVAETSPFDTHMFINTLVKSGFTPLQAENMCYMLKDVIGFVAQDLKKKCVTKSGQELALQQIMIHIGSLKKDMIILEKSEFLALRNENEKLVMELKSLRETVNDEIIKLKGGFQLDINLEKNRSTEVTFEISNRVLKLDSRIDTEISNVKAILEAFKADTVRYIAGSLFTALVTILGALRYFTL